LRRRSWFDWYAVVVLTYCALVLAYFFVALVFSFFGVNVTP
jgi:hypothetical protein